MHTVQVVSFGSSFVTPSAYNSFVISHLPSSSTTHPDYITASVPTVTLGAATAAAATQLNGTYNNSPVSIEYYVNATGAALLVYTFEIQNVALGTWYRAFVDAHSARFVSALSYVAHATVGSALRLVRISGYLLMFYIVHCRSGVGAGPRLRLRDHCGSGRLCCIAARLAK